MPITASAITGKRLRIMTGRSKSNRIMQRPIIIGVLSMIALGNYRQAIEDYSRAIEIKPGYADAYNNRGIAYNSLGNYRQAIEDYNRAIEIKPDFADAYYNRGVVYLTQG